MSTLSLTEGCVLLSRPEEPELLVPGPDQGERRRDAALPALGSRQPITAKPQPHGRHRGNAGRAARLHTAPPLPQHQADQGRRAQRRINTTILTCTTTTPLSTSLLI